MSEFLWQIDNLTVWSQIYGSEVKSDRSIQIIVENHGSDSESGFQVFCILLDQNLDKT